MVTAMNHPKADLADLMERAEEMEASYHATLRDSSGHLPAWVTQQSTPKAASSAAYQAAASAKTGSWTTGSGGVGGSGAGGGTGGSRPATKVFGGVAKPFCKVCGFYHGPGAHLHKDPRTGKIGPKPDRKRVTEVVTEEMHVQYARDQVEGAAFAESVRAALGAVEQLEVVEETEAE